MWSSEIFTQHVKGLCDLMGRLVDLLDQSVSQDPVIWENPLDVIQIIRSCYYSNVCVYFGIHMNNNLFISLLLGSGPSSKLTMSLVNDSLKFTSSDTQIF